MITAGVDIGSLTGKTVILKNGSILSWSLIPTGYDSAKTSKIATAKALEKAGLRLSQLDYIVSTGYGRVVVPFANKNVTEISCHAKGASWFQPDIRTILDMGGQDCKAISCDGNGRVTNFVMNDKCAAGVGRYLEIMAELLGMPLDEIGQCSFDLVTEPIPISSTCIVFARSEVLRSLRLGAHKNDVLAGAHEALTTRIFGLLKRVGIKKELMFTGGVAKNVGVLRRLEQRTGLMVKTSFEPQIVGALGASLFAQEAVEEINGG